MFGRIVRYTLAVLGGLALMSGAAAAQSRVTIAVGGAGCLCHLPIILAGQLGEYKKAGMQVALVDFEADAPAFFAMMYGGTADVVSSYFDHGVGLTAKVQAVKAFVTYGRYPGFALVVSPKPAGTISSVKDLANKKLGVSAPDPDRLLAYLKSLLIKNDVDPNSVDVIGIGLAGAAVAAMENGAVDAAIMVDPTITQLQGKYRDLKFVIDARTQNGTLDAFGAEYPGGTLIAKNEWIAAHPKETQAITNAVLATLKWIHSHTPEEVVANMPPELVGPDKALYLAALKNTIPMYSVTGRMEPKGAQAALDVFSQSSPESKNAKIDLSQSYTNEFVEQTQRMR